MTSVSAQEFYTIRYSGINFIFFFLLFKRLIWKGAIGDNERCPKNLALHTFFYIIVNIHIGIYMGDNNLSELFENRLSGWESLFKNWTAPCLTAPLREPDFPNYQATCRNSSVNTRGPFLFSTPPRYPLLRFVPTSVCSNL